MAMDGASSEAGREFWRYGVVGVGGVAADFLIFNVSLWAGLRLPFISPEISAKLTALFLTSAVAFGVHKVWTFQRRFSSHSEALTLLKFGFVLGLGGATGIAVIWGFQSLPTSSNFLNVNIANTVAIGTAALIRFVLTRHFVFNLETLRERENRTTPDTRKGP